MHRVNSMYTYTFTPIISLGRHWNNIATKKSGGHVSHSSLTARFFLSFFFFFFFFLFFSSVFRFTVAIRRAWNGCNVGRWFIRDRITANRISDCVQCHFECAVSSNVYRWACFFFFFFLRICNKKRGKFSFLFFLQVLFLAWSGWCFILFYYSSSDSLKITRDRMGINGALKKCIQKRERKEETLLF